MPKASQNSLGSEYQVVSPLGTVVVPPVRPRDAIYDLAGKTVGLVWNGLNRGTEIFPLLRERLEAGYPGITFQEICYPRGGDEKKIFDTLPDLLRARGCDVAISGIGGSPGTASAAVRAAMKLESERIPAVTILAAAYLSQGRGLARSLGVEDAPIAEYPGIIAVDDAQTLSEKVRHVLYERIVDAFAKPIIPTKVASIDPNDIVFAGSLGAVQDFFYEKQWTDGLPVIPPTIAEVKRFLDFTDRTADEVIALVPVENREATVWNVAVNGVMAGCRPEYMPVLLAVVEAIADPEFHVEDAGASTGWEPLIILNGPMVKTLDFNYGTAVLRAGRRANTSIGRFLRLIMINIVGCRIPPGMTDRGATAGMFNAVLPEDEDSVAELGWQPFAADVGFSAGDNVVTVQSVMGGGLPLYPGGDHASDFAEVIADMWGSNCAHWAWQTMFLGKSFPLLVISKRIASALAKDGWTKADLKEYLVRKVKVPAGLSERWARNTMGAGFSIEEWVAQGRLPGEYCESSSPERLVPVFPRADWIGIVIAGDPLRNQARGFINSHIQGGRVSRRVELPARWNDSMTQPQRKRTDQAFQSEAEPAGAHR